MKHGGRGREASTTEKMKRDTLINTDTYSLMMQAMRWTPHVVNHIPHTHTHTHTQNPERCLKP